MKMTEIAIGKNNHDVSMQLNKLNRHGLIAGATGTGKTVTLKVMAEQMSKAGIPVFLADIKGDLASLSQTGVIDEGIVGRLEKLQITDYQNQAFPVRLWDVFGTEGTPVRATISEMGPFLISRLLGLNETQTGIMNIIFKLADDQGLLLLDLKDLQALLQEVGNNPQLYTTDYGNITKQSVGAIQRSLLVLEQQGGHVFFGEPAIKLTDFIQFDQTGRGVINILMAKKLFASPILYSTFLLWLLSELFEELPEVGDLDKPKLVFFFDEAHLLFQHAPQAFVEQVEQVVRLIRSKGVGIYFVTQNPIDLPDGILGQLGNRVQHGIRAFSPKELKAVKAASDTFRPNPEVNVAEVITELKVGEALLSFLNEEGQPTMVERAFIRPPESQMAALDPMSIPSLILSSPFEEAYRETIDRESAYEILQAKALEQLTQKNQIEAEKQAEIDEKAALKLAEKTEKERQKIVKEEERKRKNNPVNKAKDSFVNTIVRTVGRDIARGVMGIFKK